MGTASFLDLCRQVARLQAERDELRATVARVEALHVVQPNSVSAMFPTPLCSCGREFPCATAKALAGDQP